MAVNTFTFGGVTSSTYGIYVSGEALFNAPKRDAEVIQIPGRDGDYILDKGSFENIEVTYRVFNQEKDLTDFRTKLANLRSALCSQVGYHRLTDTFHPNEYRMAAFIDGIEVNPVKYNTASEFEIKFNCKPQRFLTSGETAVSVASGGKVTNPTLFDARPQLQVWGYGDITIGSNEAISIVQEDVGDVLLFNQQNLATSAFYPSLDLLNTGDTFKVSGHINVRFSWKSNKMIHTPSITSSTNFDNTSTGAFDGEWVSFKADVPEVTLTKGTQANPAQQSTMDISYVSNGTTYTPQIKATLSYYAASGKVEFAVTTTGTLGTYVEKSIQDRTVNDVFGYSTIQTTGTPLYIDLDIGEAYNLDGGTPVSVNNAVSIPAELPTLPSGDTTITYDNTITQFKVLPRWWRV